MRKVIIWGAVIACLISMICFGVVGVKVSNGNYDITVVASIGMVFLVIFSLGTMYLRLTNRCKSCGRLLRFYGKYCPHCGEELN